MRIRWLLAATGLLILPYLVRAQITYVDITDGGGGNTMEWNGGSPVVWNPVPDDAADNQWRARAFGAYTTIYESNGNAGFPEDAPGLVTTLTGLVPGETYAISAYFWSDTSNGWILKASITSPPPLDPTDTDPTVSWTPFGTGNRGAGVAVPVDGNGFGTIFVQDDVLAVEGNRVLYQAPLGEATASAGGEVEVYLDDLANAESSNNRTWPDGVGYRLLGAPPVFTESPADTDAVLGDTVTLQAAVFSDSPVSLQWRKDGSPLAGETNATLVIEAATPVDEGAYDVVATSVDGETISDPGVLRILGPAVLPAQQVAIVDFDATFTLDLPANTGLVYTIQWKRDGVDIEGETGPSYTLAMVSIDDNGAVFTADVTLSGETVTSQEGLLRVPNPPVTSYEQTIQNAGPVAYWRLGELPDSPSALDSAGGLNLGAGEDTEFGVTGVILGDPDTAARFLQSTSVLEDSVLARPALNTPIFSVECWTVPTGGGGERVLFDSSDEFDFGDGVERTGYMLLLNGDNEWEFRIGDAVPDNEWSVATAPAAIGSWAHVVATFDGSIMIIYVNGVEQGRFEGATLVSNSAALWAFTLGGGKDGFGQINAPFVGVIDEAVYYDRALTAQEALDHYGANFQADAEPLITLPPVDTAVLIGESATFTAGAFSSTPATYQWQYNTVDIPGATESVYTVEAAAVDDGGQYRVVISNFAGSVTSDPGTLVVLGDLIGSFVYPTAENTVLSANAGMDFFTTAGAGGQQWWARTVFGIIGIAESVYGYMVDVNPPADTQIETTVDGLVPGTEYAVWVLWGWKGIIDGGATTQPAILAGHKTPAPNPQEPLGLFNTDNSLDTGEISVSASDPWNVFNGYLGIRAADANGEITVLLDYAPGAERTVYHGLGYQIAVPVPAPPVITIPPVDQAAPVGSTNTSFSVVAGSVLEQTYQWSRNGVPIAGATNATLAFDIVQASDAGIYSVAVSNSEGATVSPDARLVVISDYFENFVFPDETNTVLTRDPGLTWFTNDNAVAGTDGLWFQNPDFAVDGVSDTGFSATAADPSRELRTTLTGLDPGEDYAIWGLYSFPPGQFGSRIGMGLEGEILRTWDDGHLDTGILNGPADGYTVFAGFLGIRTANSAGEINVYVDFIGLTESYYNGLGVQRIDAVTPGILLGIDLSGGGPTITWDDPAAVLQGSSDLTDEESWSDLPGAASPYLDPGTDPSRGFRLREP